MISFGPDGSRVTYPGGSSSARRYRRRARIWLAVVVLLVLIALVALIVLAAHGSESGNGTSPVPTTTPTSGAVSHTDWTAWIIASTGVAALCLSTFQTVANSRKARRLDRQAATATVYQPDPRGYM